MKDLFLNIAKEVIVENNLEIYFNNQKNQMIIIDKKYNNNCKDFQKIDVNIWDYDFTLLNYKNGSQIELEIPNNYELKILYALLNKNIDSKIYKKFLINYNYPFKNWREIKDLFFYKNNIDNEFREIAIKYKGAMNSFDFSDIFKKLIEKYEDTIDVILAFTLNNIETLKKQQIISIKNFIDKKGTEEQLNFFEEILNNNNKSEIINNNEELFEDKENRFEYINLNAQAIYKKYYIDSNIKIDNYEKLLRDTIAVLRGYKKELGFEHMYLENRSNSKNDFLISVEITNNFNKDFVKYFIKEYLNIYKDEINQKISEANGVFSSSCIYEADNKLKTNKKKTYQFIKLNYTLQNKENIHKVKNKI